MAKKMYYSQEEAAEKLGGAEAIEKLVRDSQLRAYQDGAKRMFKADDVDALSGEAGEDTQEIQLSPVDSAAGEEISLSETDQVKPPGKEDTVITSEGISVFDDEDLEIEEADPLAKTHVAAAMEDQLSSDSVGAGSGLLDLTRESDDTSLGAEILDHIDMEGAIGSSIAEAVAAEPDTFEAQAPGAAGGPVFVEAEDASSGLFGGMIVGSSVVMLLVGLLLPAATTGATPGYVEAMRNNLPTVLVAMVAIVAVAGLAGFLVGRMAFQRRQVMRRAGI